MSTAGRVALWTGKSVKGIWDPHNISHLKNKIWQFFYLFFKLWPSKRKRLGTSGLHDIKTELSMKESVLMRCYLDFLKSTQRQVIYRKRNRKRQCARIYFCRLFSLWFNMLKIKKMSIFNYRMEHMNKLFLRCLWAKGSVCVLYICLLHYKCMKLSAQVHWK